MQTIILGKRSQLTKRLVKEIPITKVLGSEEIKDIMDEADYCVNC